MSDDSDRLGDSQPDERGEDVVFRRMCSLDVLQTVQHPTEVSLLVEEVGQEEDRSDGFSQQGQGHVAAWKPLWVKLKQKVQARSEIEVM